MIRATALTVRAGARHLLRDISVQLRPGTLTAVLGPNGAGKTTLLRTLAGERAPDAGALTLAGRPLAAFDRVALARRRAVLSQHHAAAFGLTVAEVVVIGRLPHRATASAHDDRTASEAAAECFGLAPLWRRSLATLSGGERQRVQLARIAAQLWRRDADHHGQALFLDEPAAALDLARQVAALGFARRMAAGGAAVLANLHDPNQAAVAGQVILLREGRVIAAGPPEAVLTPANLTACLGVEVEAVPRPGGGVLFAVVA